MFFKKNNKKAPQDVYCKKKKTSLITGIIVGGAVGSVISLLFAPDKGEKTRKKVYKTGKELLTDGKTKAEDFLDKYKNKVQEKIDE